MRELWIAEQFASILDMSADDLCAVSSGNLPKMIEVGIGLTSEGSARTFAALLEKSPSSLAEWRAGIVYPSVPTLLSMSLRFGIPLRAWLTGEVVEWNSVVLRHQFRAGPSMPPRAVERGRDWPKIERELRALAADNEYCSSWAKTARNLGIDASQLQGRYPELARRIAMRAREARGRASAERREARETALRQRVRRVIQDLLASGIEPTRRHVEAELAARTIEFRWADYPLLSQVKDEVRQRSGVGRQKA